MWATFRHLEHSQKSHTKKKVHNILLVGLVVRFFQISSIYITSRWLKNVYWSWLRVQNKFHCKLPNEGCMRMFSLFSSFKTVGLIGAFQGLSLPPLPIFATLLTYTKFQSLLYTCLFQFLSIAACIQGSSNGFEFQLLQSVLFIHRHAQL